MNIFSHGVNVDLSETPDALGIIHCMILTEKIQRNTHKLLNFSI